MKAITAAVNELYNEKDRPEYNIEDLLEEVRLSSERYIIHLSNIYEHHPELMGDAKNTGAMNALLEDISRKIYNLRKD